MDEWKIIKREITQAGNEWVIRSLRLPKELDDYCSTQGNASDFIRDLIRRHKQGREIVELTDAEEAIRVAIFHFYEGQGKWSRQAFESGESYPPLERMTDEHLQQLIDAVLKEWYLRGNEEALQLAERCKNDMETWKKVYAKLREYEWHECRILRDKRDVVRNT